MALYWALLAWGHGMSGQRESQPKETPSKPESNPPDKSLRSAVLWLRQMRELGERQTSDAALRLRRISLTVLCLMTLPACSPVKLLQRDPAPAVAPCPMVQCLDRALKTCEGVDPPQMGVRTCQDAVLLASDALGEIVYCQQAHAALIECVEQFNQQRRGEQ